MEELEISCRPARDKDYYILQINSFKIVLERSEVRELIGKLDNQI